MAKLESKSDTWRSLDAIRQLIIVLTIVVALYFIWKIHWILAIVVAAPMYVLLLNLVGFLTLPLYFLTPERKVSSEIWKCIEQGESDGLKTSPANADLTWKRTVRKHAKMTSRELFVKLLREHDALNFPFKPLWEKFTQADVDKLLDRIATSHELKTEDKAEADFALLVILEGGIPSSQGISCLERVFPTITKSILGMQAKCKAHGMLPAN